MMISAQTICMSSSRTPQSGSGINSPVSLSPWRRPASLKCSRTGFRKGRGHSTFAIEQALPFFSSPEDASDDGVPAKYAGVRDSGTGTKNVELVDPISLAQLASTVDYQLPSLLSMVVDGFPPLQRSKYEHEGEKRLQRYVERYRDVVSFDSYNRVGISAVTYTHPGVINIDRFEAMAIHYALLFLLDDFFFDSPTKFHDDEYGICRDARESPQKIQEYLDHLDAVFSQQVQPSKPTPLIETMMWESGRDMLELSNPEWFKKYVACVVEHHHTCTTSHSDIVQGHNLCFQDLESYTVMRAGNVGGKVIQLLIEFANDIYIPDTLRASPYFENITMIASIHVGFANDVFSYYKGSLLEQNPRNLITVLTKCEGKPFVQTVHMAIGLVNTYAHAFMELEVEASNPTLRNYLQDIKALIAGNIYVSYVNKRYRHPYSIFPELRGIHDQ